MPAAVQTPRFQQFLAKLFGLRESRAFDVEDIILPTVDVVDVTAPEYRWINGGERLVAGDVTVTSGVGVFATGALENPAGSGVLLVLEAAFAHALGAAMRISWGLVNSTGIGASAGGSVKCPRDGRGISTGGVSFSRGDLRQVAGGQAFNAAYNVNYLPQVSDTAGGTLSQIPAIIIPPGWSFATQAAGANAAFNLGVAWRERSVETSEL